MTEAVWLAVIAAVGAVISSIITSLTTLKGKKFDSSNNEIKELIAQNNKDTAINKELIRKVESDLNQHTKNQSVLNAQYGESLKILLRQNIDDMYQLYYKKEKCMSKQSKEELVETFTIYKKLGGNHIGERRFTKLMELPEPDELEEL